MAIICRSKRNPVNRELWLCDNTLKEGVKKRIFYGQADCKVNFVGGVNACGQPDREISVFLRRPLTNISRINHDIDNSDWRLQSDIIYKNIESIISSLWEKQRAQSNTYLLHPAQPRETKFYVEATEDGKVRIFLLFKGNLLFLCMLQYRFKWKISSVWLRTQKKINNWQEY